MYLGIDVGSVSTNLALIGQEKKLIAYHSILSGFDHKQTVEKAVSHVLDEHGIDASKIRRIVSTGYGRKNVKHTWKAVTEITCHVIGVRHLFPDAQVVIDIGGQDSKVIWISEQGYVESFSMNDKCSAGTGRFLEVMAGIMTLSMDDFSSIGLQSKRPYPISSTCTVFAESEVISGIASGASREDLAAGMYEAITSRILSLVGDIGKAQHAVLTGGVANNMGVYMCLKKKIPGLKRPFEPQITGALGAALIAARDE